MNIGNRDIVSRMSHNHLRETFAWTSFVDTKARAEAARKVVRTVDRLIRTYMYREDPFMNDPEMSLTQIDSELIEKILQRLPEEAKKRYELTALTEKIRHQMIEYRRGTLDMLCSDKESQKLFFLLQKEALPTHEQILSFTDEEISKLLYALSNGTIQPPDQEEMQVIQKDNEPTLIQAIETLAQEGDSLSDAALEKCYEFRDIGNFAEMFREFLAAILLHREDEALFAASEDVTKRER